MRRSARFVCLLSLVLAACNEDPPTTDDADACEGAECSDAADIGGFDAAGDTADADEDTAPEDTGEADAETDTAPDVAEEVDAGPVDSDNDGVIDDLDAFPDDETEWADTDSDGVGDNADACPEDPTDWVDTDGDGVCDASDACPDDDAETIDSDDDGVCDLADAFPDDETEWADTDSDGVGDNADDDDDGDGISDVEEMEYGADCLVSNPLRADSDGDEIPDPEDPYPLDEFVEFMVRGNDAGTIDLFLSNRDGTFREPVAIGEPLEFEGRALTYGSFSVGDFDRDGRVDFTAHSSRLYPDTDGDTRRNFYFFYRAEKEDEFRQAFIGVTDTVIAGALVDANADNQLDVARVEYDRDGNITGGRIKVFLNTYSDRVSCVYSEDPADLCFFHHASTLDLTSVVSGEWTSRMAFQAVNLNPDTDAHRDLTILTYASGGNAATDIYSIFGNGDGSFAAPVLRFTHNADRSQAPGNSILFADFDGDEVGDVLVGFDDDGEAGEAWTYLGDGAGGFLPSPIDAVDLNPTDANEVGGRGETLGRTGSGRTFDVNYDGAMDLLIGYDHVNYASAGQTRLYLGNGDGTFGPAFTVIGDESTQRHNFGVPTRLCPEYAFTTPETDTD